MGYYTVDWSNGDEPTRAESLAEAARIGYEDTDFDAPIHYHRTVLDPENAVEPLRHETLYEGTVAEVFEDLGLVDQDHRFSAGEEVGLV